MAHMSVNLGPCGHRPLDLLVVQWFVGEKRTLGLGIRLEQGNLIPM